MKRVLVLVPFPLDDDALDNRRAQTAEVLLRPDVAYEYRAVAAGPTSFVSPHDWALLDAALFEAGLGAEEEGYDAVVIDTVSDSGAEGLRSMLDIPVVAPGRASLLFALTLGGSFGILAQWEPALTRYRKVIAEWGLSQHCAGVEHFDTPPDFAALIHGKESQVLPRMEAACHRLVETSFVLAPQRCTKPTDISRRGSPYPSSIRDLSPTSWRRRCWRYAFPTAEARTRGLWCQSRT